jgi:hypothetical protein
MMTHRSAAARRALLRTLTLSTLAAAGAALPAATPVLGQEPVAAERQQPVFALLPDSAAERLVAFYNREATTRLVGDARIGPATAVRGDVAVLAGNLVVEGNVEGDVVVINGTLQVRPGGRIGGTAAVAGGDIAVQPGGVLAGGGQSWREPLRYRYQDNRITYIPPEQERGLAAGIDLPFGRTDLFAAVHTSYNRVEGLPIAVGPRIRFGGTHPTSARALLIVRTAAGSELDPHRFGYDVSAQQLVAPRAGLSVGLRLFSEVAPIESWQMPDRETGLATFVLHRDYRDHYEREGWSAFLHVQRPGMPWTLELQYRDEEHVSRAASDPLTILDNDGAWRAQPAIAEGALRSVVARGTWDSRNEGRDPSAGWLVHAELEQGLGGTIVNQAARVDGVPGQRPGRTGYRTGFIDMRRYARLSPYSRLALRVVAAGSLDARALPPQRQHALGGEGSLPGYRLFEQDCGARRELVELRGHAFHPYYGCDRMTLVQLEYQANFPFARRLAESAGLSGSVGNLIRWVAFFDAGRAWTEAGALDSRLGGDDFSADAGVGLRFGPLGAYWAVPLSGRGQGFNFFVRLGPRL